MKILNYWKMKQTICFHNSHIPILIRYWLHVVVQKKADIFRIMIHYHPYLWDNMLITFDHCFEQGFL